ncbi:MAG: NAD-dependent epimerase/dehydratase family protein [Sarcina sp.]
MRILVMGGTEFVGSSVAKHLIAKGHKVDIFTRGNKELKYAGVNVQHKGDRKSVEDLKSSIASIKYEYVFDISAYKLIDVKSLFEVLDTSNLKRYIMCSSGAVYKASNEVMSEEFEVGENENWGVYGLDKLEAEQYLMELYKEKGLPVVMFRPSYIYGEGNNLYRESYIFDRLTQGLDIPIPDSETKTQFIYIDDLVKVFESAMYNDKVNGQGYNLTHTQEVSWEELISVAKVVTNSSSNIKKVNVDTAKVSREYFPFRDCTYLLSVNKSIKDGLYIPKVDLLEGLKLSYEWYLKEQPKLNDARMIKVEEVLK